MESVPSAALLPTRASRLRKLLNARSLGYQCSATHMRGRAAATAAASQGFVYQVPSPISPPRVGLIPIADWTKSQHTITEQSDEKSTLYKAVEPRLHGPSWPTNSPAGLRLSVCASSALAADDVAYLCLVATNANSRASRLCDIRRSGQRSRQRLHQPGSS